MRSRNPVSTHVEPATTLRIATEVVSRHWGPVGISLHSIALLPKRSPDASSYTRHYKARTKSKHEGDDAEALLPNEQIPSTVIVRQAPEDFDAENSRDWEASAFFRDWAALQYLSQIDTPRAHGPQVYGGHRRYGTLILEDLGPKELVLEDLLSLAPPVHGPPTPQKRQLAQSACVQFSRRLASMHADTMGTSEVYYDILNGINAKVARAARQYGGGYLSDLRVAEVTETLQYLLGEEFSEGFFDDLRDELTTVTETMRKPSEFIALVHMDVRPDQVIVRHTGNVRLVGFGVAAPGHALLDWAAVRMGFPVSLAVQKIPGALLRTMQSAYYQHLKSTVSHRGCSLGERTFGEQLTLACAFWIARVLDDLADADGIDSESDAGDEDHGDEVTPPFDVVQVRSQILARMDAFVEVCDECPGHAVPALHSATKTLANQLRSTWGRVPPLPVYSALNDE